MFSSALSVPSIPTLTPAHHTVPTGTHTSTPHCPHWHFTPTHHTVPTGTSHQHNTLSPLALHTSTPHYPHWHFTPAHHYPHSHQHTTLSPLALTPAHHTVPTGTSYQHTTLSPLALHTSTPHCPHWHFIPAHHTVPISIVITLSH